MPSVFKPKPSPRSLGLQWAGGKPAQQVRDNTIGAPTLSIAFTTLRPGGYDVLLESLARQTSMDFELICIDSLAESRRQLIFDYARRLGLGRQLVIARPDKQQRKARNCPFGFANAINTGILLARGKIFTGMTDYTWVDPNFVKNTIEHYENYPNSLLSHQQAYYYFPDDIVNHTALHDPMALSTFNFPMTMSPDDYGWTMKPDPYTPLPVPKAVAQYSGQYFWDGTALTISMELLEKLNGFDELMDSGKESHNMDIADRAIWMFGALVFVDGRIMMGNLAHHEVKTDKAFYNPPDQMVFSNLYRWVSDLLPRMKLGDYPAKARNWFDVADIRRTRDPSRPLEEALERYDPGTVYPWIEFLAPENFKITPTRDVALRVQVHNFALGQDGQICYILVPKGVVKTPEVCWSNNDPLPVTHHPGVYYLRAYLRDKNGVVVPTSDAVLSYEVRQILRY